MKGEEKNILIEELKEIVESYPNFYLTNMSGLDAQETSDIRRKCFENSIKLKIVKNTLFKLALDKAEGNYEELYDVLKENTSVMFCDIANGPGKIIKNFKSSNDNPTLKAAFIDGTAFIGKEHLETLANLKSKEELVGDIVLLLQSPIKTVMGQLESSKNIVAGLVKTLSERE